MTVMTDNSAIAEHYNCSRGATAWGLAVWRRPWTVESEAWSCCQVPQGDRWVSVDVQETDNPRDERKIAFFLIFGLLSLAQPGGYTNQQKSWRRLTSATLQRKRETRA